MENATTTRVDRLRTIAQNKRSLLTLIYGSPDPDALASAFALNFILHRSKSDSTIAYTGEIGRLENEEMIRVLKIPASKFEPKMLSEHDLIATVDCQPPFFLKIPDLKVDIVIDHHPRQKFSAAFTDIRPDYGSTSTIMTEYLQKARMKVPTKLATALYYGLETDTANLQRIASDADISAFRFLRSRADMTLIRVIRLSHFPLSSLSYFAVAALQKRYHGGIIYTNLGFVNTPDVIAHIADFLMGFHKIAWALVSGLYRDLLIVVIRSDGHRKDAGALATKAFGSLGSAGGRSTMARAELPLLGIRSGLPNMNGEAVEKFVLGRLAPHLRGVKKLR
jgi:nanoRNase/pAp phosphatase (c-di-AMP/oligoRNAs hydrolase)